MPKNLRDTGAQLSKAAKKREINARLYVNQSNSVLVDVGFPQPLGSTARATLELQKAITMSTVPWLGFRVQRSGGVGASGHMFLKGKTKGPNNCFKRMLYTRELFEMMLGNGPEF
jgi:hypothetical protein